MMPLPVPVVAVTKLNVLMAKVAVTLVFAVIVTTHVPAPLHAPLQPLNVELMLGVAVNVTTVL